MHTLASAAAAAGVSLTSLTEDLVPNDASGLQETRDDSLAARHHAVPRVTEEVILVEPVRPAESPAAAAAAAPRPARLLQDVSTEAVRAPVVVYSAGAGIGSLDRPHCSATAGGRAAFFNYANGKSNSVSDTEHMKTYNVSVGNPDEIHPSTKRMLSRTDRSAGSAEAEQSQRRPAGASGHSSSGSGSSSVVLLQSVADSGVKDTAKQAGKTRSVRRQRPKSAAESAAGSKTGSRGRGKAGKLAGVGNGGGSNSGGAKAGGSGKAGGRVGGTMTTTTTTKTAAAPISGNKRNSDVAPVDAARLEKAMLDRVSLVVKAELQRRLAGMETRLITDVRDRLHEEVRTTAQREVAHKVKEIVAASPKPVRAGGAGSGAAAVAASAPLRRSRSVKSPPSSAKSTSSAAVAPAVTVKEPPAAGLPSARSSVSVGRGGGGGGGGQRGQSGPGASGASPRPGKKLARSVSIRTTVSTGSSYGKDGKENRRLRRSASSVGKNGKPVARSQSKRSLGKASSAAGVAAAAPVPHEQLGDVARRIQQHVRRMERKQHGPFVSVYQRQHAHTTASTQLANTIPIAGVRVQRSEPVSSLIAWPAAARSDSEDDGAPF